MKTKKLVSLILALLMLAGVFSIPVSAAETSAAVSGDASGTINGLKYYASDGKAEIVAYEGTNSYVKIPETIDDCPVVSINDEAFVDNKKLRTVVIPVSVEYIGNGAFDGVVSTLKILYSSTKSDWDKITIGPNNDSVKTNNVVFCYGDVLQYQIIDSKAKIYGTNEKESNLVVPNKIEGCTVEAILSYGFSDYHELETITLPDTVKSIGYEGFSMNNVKKIVLGKGLNYISDSAFMDLYDITDVYYNGTKEDWEKITVDNNNDDLFKATFHYLPEDINGLEYSWKADGTLSVTGYHGSKTDVTIPETFAGTTITEIGEEAFLNNKTVESVSVPSCVKIIGNQAFRGLTNLKTVTLAEGLEIIGVSAFRSDTSVKKNRNPFNCYRN